MDHLKDIQKQSAFLGSGVFCFESSTHPLMFCSGYRKDTLEILVKENSSSLKGKKA